MDFTVALHEENHLMTERHRVMHSVWTADLELTRLDGVSSAFRRRGPEPSKDWTIEELCQLAQDINELHQLALAELARSTSR